MRPLPVVEVVSPRVTGTPFLQVWRAKDYDAGEVNTCVVQHPGSGLVYAGNNAGVLEYDGARWRLLPLPKGGAVQALAVDAHGHVWVGASNEIARLEPNAAGILHAVTILGDLPAGETGAITRAIAAPDGVWFGGLQHILRIAPDGRVATWHTDERFGSIWWMDGAVHTVASDHDVVRLEGDGELRPVFSLDALHVPASRMSPFQVYAAREVADGEWRLLTALGPARWQSREHTWRPLPVRPPLFRATEAMAATFLADGSMVFALRPGSLIIVSAGGAIQQGVDRVPQALSPRATQLMEDREGGLWLAGRERLARLQLQSAFSRHGTPQDLQASPRQMVRHAGRLYLAHTLGVSRFDEWPGVFPAFDALYREADALTTVGDRLYSAATGLIEIANGPGGARSLSNVAITTLSGWNAAPDALLAGDAQGLWLFHQDGREWNPRGRLQKLSLGVTAIFDRGDGMAWGAATDGRLWRADFRGGLRLDAPVELYDDAQGVPRASPVQRINFFPLGDALVATCGAWLLRFEATANRFTPETRIAGIADPAHLGAEAIGVNSDGTCWLRLGAPDRRILHVVPDGPGHWRSEELPAPMLRDLAAVSLLEDKHTLWISGTDLLVSADLDWKSPQNAVAPAARLRRVATEDGTARWGDAGAGPAKRLTLAAGDTALRFEFTAAAFAPDHRGRPCVQYRTQLVGFERAWTAWSPEPWRDFTNLRHGRYTFRVQARDLTGQTGAPAVLGLDIAAPWWLTPWAWTSYTLGAGLLVFGFVAVRTHALHRHTAQLEATVTVRTEELRRTNAELARLHRLELDEKTAARLAEEQARLEVLRYQLNPHFLYNALNSIYSLVLTAPPAAANMVLRLADFCRVALDRRQEEHTTVGAEFDKLTTYLEIEKVRWGDSLHVVVAADEVARRAAVPPFLLLPLVENAIKYGGATSAEALHVRVTAGFDPAGALRLAVANSGTWVEPNTLPNVKSSGIGLANLRQRLKRYHPGAHEIAIEQPDGWVVVKLTISNPGLPLGSPPSPTAL